ncbi:MAG: NAD-dependent epimerase/dehydratase family protein [bacterium]
MDKKKVFITGMSGYLGGCLCRELDRSSWCESFHGMDVKRPLAKYDKGEFRKLDINDPALYDWLLELKPDVLVHLAFIVDPIHDEELMRKINVDGTRSVLHAAAKAGTPQVLVASSGTAYGAWPDNPVPLHEDHPIRPHPTFRYANDKARVEFLCREFMEENPETITSIIRPCVVYGSLVNNYLSELISMPLAVAVPREHNPDLQFIHEDDVAGAILTILEREGQGAFNLAPPDTITLVEAVAIAGRRALYLPDKVLEALARAAWFLRLPLLKAPASFLDFMRYPWVLDSSRLREELGYTFRYSTRETFEIMVRSKGILKE